ncbi:MAG: hypothetical protein JXD22_11900 [Sedimentisphaerales bacterium]|nr:hypothetical protein [Sedimentisphaerales bacterium]
MRFKIGYLLLTVTLLLGGCAEQYIAGKSVDELIELSGRRDQADRWRLEIFDEVLARPLAPQQQQRLGQILAEVAGSPLHSPVIRSCAIEIIAERYPDKAGQWLSGALVSTTEQDIRQQIIAKLIRLSDRSSLGNLTVDLAKNSVDLAKNSAHDSWQNNSRQSAPVGERDPGNADDPWQTSAVAGAMVSIADAQLEEILFDQLSTAEGVKVRLAALKCLVELLGTEQTVKLISSLPDDGAFAGEVRFWAMRFGYVPTNAARLFLCSYQRTHLSAEQFSRLSKLTANLQGRENYHFNPTDSYLLLSLDETQLNKSGNDLVAEIDKTLVRLSHSKRPPGYAGARDDYHEEFAGQRNQLCYTDLLRIKLLLKDLSPPMKVAVLKQHLRDDLSQIDSEIGGLSFLEPDGVRFERYPPGSRLGDNQYFESAQMIEAAGLCLTRWHCHADSHRIGYESDVDRPISRDRSGNRDIFQQPDDSHGTGDMGCNGSWRMAELAGPGVDDLDFVEYCGCPLVIITQLPYGRCNVDYVSSDGVVIDLGNY